MSDLQVTTESVRDAGSRADALASEFAEALAQSDATAARLAGGSWTGPASDAFSAGWAEWHRGALEVQAALAGMAQLLEESAIQYEGTESTLAREASATSSTRTAAR